MLLFGLFVLIEAGDKIVHPVLPTAEYIGAIGLLALLANLACLYLLWKHRSDDINMQSVWLCSRNDVIANSGVLLAALGVAMLQSRWPDIIIGLIIAALFLHSAFHVLRNATRQYQQCK
jgi:Co/Zn/Cd efflux system component